MANEVRSFFINFAFRDIYIPFMNEEAQLAWQIIETTDSHLFLTGRAGTGKTTFLRTMRERSSKRMVVVAPTGIAAINAGGVTIHSLFQLPFAPYLPDTTFSQKGNQYRFSKEKIKILRAIDMLVIDEISMVRADLLDAVSDTLCRYRRSRLPFGGVQLVMIGDLAQLAPVATPEEWQLLARSYESPYFFSSRALAKTDFAVVELKHVYRQSDSRFIDILNKVRDKTVDSTVLAALNKRYKPNFQPAASEGYIRLTTHNAQAKAINDEEMAKLQGKPFTYIATIEGKFPEYSFPTDERLVLKKGAQVMFVKNDSSPSKRYYNGMIGTITDIGNEAFVVKPKDGNEDITVKPELWENCRYAVNEKTKEITEEVEGRFMQMPVKAAWAITIHKSQGLTFDKAIIDAASSFAHGQTYVALSRCRTIDGMVLSSPLPASAIIHDHVVDSFITSSASHHPDADMLKMMQKKYFLHILNELFDFTEIYTLFGKMKRITTENFRRSQPKAVEDFAKYNGDMAEKVINVAEKFHTQYLKMTEKATDFATDLLLQERIQKGATYFSDKLQEAEKFIKTVKLATENKELQQRIAENMTTMTASLALKIELLDYIKNNGFSVEKYLKHKSEVILGGEKRKNSKREKTQRAYKESTDVAAKLTEWRAKKSKELGIPAYCIMWQKTLNAIAEALPTNKSELVLMPNFGLTKVKKYGKEIIEIIKAEQEKSI